MLLLRFLFGVLLFFEKESKGYGKNKIKRNGDN